jgi:hypothetical protein
VLFDPGIFINQVNILEGIHKGIVVAVDYLSDTAKVPLIRCSIEGLIEGSADELPYFRLRYPIAFGGKSGVNFQWIPEVGAQVAIIFPDFDLYSGEIVGHYDNSNVHETDFDANYPDEYGFKDSKGNIFKVNKDTGDITITHYSGAEVVVDSTGIVVTTGDVVADGISLKHHTHPLPASLDTTVTVVVGGPPTGAVTGIDANTDEPE